MLERERIVREPEDIRRDIDGRYWAEYAHNDEWGRIEKHMHDVPPSFTPEQAATLLAYVAEADTLFQCDRPTDARTLYEPLLALFVSRDEDHYATPDEVEGLDVDELVAAAREVVDRCTGAGRHARTAKR